MEFELGITERHPFGWGQSEPLWQDETITASSSHSVFDMMNKLCETAIKNRREYDHGVNDHLWKLKIMPYKQATSPRKSRGQEFLWQEESGSDSELEDEDEDEDEDAYCRPVVIEAREFNDDFDEESFEKMTPKKMLTAELLPQNSVIEVTYDYGTTTTLFLKVLKVRPAVVRSLLQYFSLEGSNSDSNLQKIMKTVPAFALPMDQQIDVYFPNFSKIFLGKYVPILTLKESEEANLERNGDPHGYCDNRISCASLGKSACIRHDSDTPFSCIEGRTSESDVMNCPVILEPNEFLQVAELAWTPKDRDHDVDKLINYTFDGIIRFLAPFNDNEVYNKLLEMKNEDGGFGPHILIHRLSSLQSRSVATFNFQKVFPKTYAMLTNEKFRWFQYKKGILRVIVGRGVGYMHRHFESEQVLKIWRYNFESFHELLCAVEASWIWNGKELKADMCIPKFDGDLGPSHPGPTKPFSLGKKEDCVIITQSSELKMVTALAITEEKEKDGKAKTVLYSGHDDGTLCKWSLDDNVQLWAKQIYTDEEEEEDDFYDSSMFCVASTMGVAGITVRPRSSGREHLVYTWTHAYEGYPQKSFDAREPSKVKCWSPAGTIVRSYSCDVGYDDSGEEKAHPSIGAVVFCQLYNKDYGRWVDSMVVGLHCAAESYIWGDNYSEGYNKELAQESGEGNILPFFEHTGEKMETWRESMQLIQSLAVIPKKYVLSLSIRLGHGLPDALILWSCKEPGIPICRYDFWKPSKNHLKESKSRLHCVTGMSVWGKNIVIADDFSDRVAAFCIEEDSNGNKYFELKGYAKVGNRYYEGQGFHGRTAALGPWNIMANESFPDVWMFQNEVCCNHPKLDQREGNLHRFDNKECQSTEEENPFAFAARDIAVGHYEFPLWGGNTPKRKKRKRRAIFGDGSEITEDDRDGHGTGGPIVLAIRGKWLVAGFTNGIARTPHLPSQFVYNQRSVNANDSSSSSHISSCEWHTPILEFKDKASQRNECSIQ